MQIENSIHHLRLAYYRGPSSLSSASSRTTTHDMDQSTDIDPSNLLLMAFTHITAHYFISRMSWLHVHFILRITDTITNT